MFQLFSLLYDVRLSGSGGKNEKKKHLKQNFIFFKIFIQSRILNFNDSENGKVSICKHNILPTAHSYIDTTFNKIMNRNVSHSI